MERKRKALGDLLGPDKKSFKREQLLEAEEALVRKKLITDKQIDHIVTLGNQSNPENYEDSYMSERQSIHQTKSGSQSSDQSSAPCSQEANDAPSAVAMLPRKEVIRRLRERSQPIKLFGETDYDVFLRLRKLEVCEPEMDRGLRNDFQEAMDKVDQDYLNEINKSCGSLASVEGRSDVKITEMNTSIEEMRKLAQNLGSSKRNDLIKDCDIIYKFFKFLLELWGRELNSRPMANKISTQGKIRSATYTQTQTYLKPLFKQLKNHTIAEDIQRHLTLIINDLLDRNYVGANAHYLQMAIGNSPWPIGVTMVGIHARTGREKISMQNIAHVLNDETQRKYIQGIKRLMTQCQKSFPTDPSRSVEYQAI